MFAARVKLRNEVADIALVSPNAELRERLRAAFKAKRSEYCAIDGPLTRLAEEFDPATGPAVLIADLDDDRAGAIAAIEALRRKKFDGAIVTISDNLDEQAVRGLLHCRIADWLPVDAPTEAIVEACERARASRSRPEPVRQSLCMSLVPAAGGVGTTTLAVQTAFLLAQRSRDFRSTCLIDLNFQSGALADYLDLQPGFKIETVASAPERLDAHLLEVMLARHSTGLAVLAAPRTPGACVDVDAAVVRQVLGIAAEMFRHMVIDMPPTWQPWADDVLAGSDRIFVVTEFTVPALRKAQELASSLQERLGDKSAIRTIVNKSRRQFWGVGLTRRDAREMLGKHLSGFVPEDHGLVRDAINRGKPLTALRRSNRVSRALAGIVMAK